MKLVSTLAALLSVLAATAVHGAPRVDSGIHRTLQSQGTVNLIVTMRDSPTRALEQSTRRLEQFESRGEMLTYLSDKLKAHARSSQAGITKLLAQESSNVAPLPSEVKSFWVSNQLFFRDATFELVIKLAELPGIASITEEQVRQLSIVHADGSNSTSTPITVVEWGASRIQAPEVWATGNKGQGIDVGIIDTGVRATHEALAGSFRGDYGWYDPENKTALPYDSHGHGSHVTGTIAGDYGIGVAPAAKWMMCKGCRGRDCFDSDLLECFQFMTCPTGPSGGNSDCAKAPRIVSNSWGFGQNDKIFEAALATWRQAGIIPIFSLGNKGPACGTASSPGDSTQVISVGSTDSMDGLSPFSSRGPSVTGLLKPEISAPGSDIVSAWGRDDMDYVSNSGTSMAAPHVSGAVALLLSAQPTLTYEQVRELLISTADQAILRPTGEQCGGSVDGVFPSNMYGHGRLNVRSMLTGVRGPTPEPTLPPVTEAPVPTPDCILLDPLACQDTIFCSWHIANATCTEWWI